MRRLLAVTTILMLVASAASASVSQTITPPFASSAIFGPDPVFECDDPALDCFATSDTFVDEFTGELHLGLDAFVEEFDGETASNSAARRAHASISETALIEIDIDMQAGFGNRLSGIASVTQNSHITRTSEVRGAQAKGAFTRSWACTTMSGQRCAVTVTRDRRFGFDVLTITVGGGRGARGRVRCMAGDETVTLAYVVKGSASVRSLAHSTVTVDDQIGQLQLTQPDC